MARIWRDEVPYKRHTDGMAPKPWFQANIHAPRHRLRIAGHYVLLAVSDRPFSDLRVDPQGWLGPTVVSGESQALQGRLTMNPLSV